MGKTDPEICDKCSTIWLIFHWGYNISEIDYQSVLFPLWRRLAQLNHCFSAIELTRCVKIYRKLNKFTGWNQYNIRRAVLTQWILQLEIMLLRKTLRHAVNGLQVQDIWGIHEVLGQCPQTFSIEPLTQLISWPKLTVHSMRLMWNHYLTNWRLCVMKLRCYLNLERWPYVWLVLMCRFTTKVFERDCFWNK